MSAGLFGLRLLGRGALGLADVLEDGLAPAVDVDPRTVPDTVAGAGHVNHVAGAARGGDAVVRLLVRDDDDAVVRSVLRLVYGIQRLTQVGARVRLAGVHGVAQGEATAGRD